VTFGQGDEHIVFVAHIDEVGFRVQSIRDDGRLVLRWRGGLYPSLWEAQAAVVHGKNGVVPAVFEPRANYYDAKLRTPADPLTVYSGVSAREQAVNLGIEEGKTTVAMPKKMLRIGKGAVLRAMDRSNLTPRHFLDEILGLAKSQRIPAQRK